MSQDESEVPNQHAARARSLESEDNDVRRREWLSRITLGELAEKNGVDLLCFNPDGALGVVVPISVLVELRDLRAQVASLQARGTEQVSLARFQAFEMAAKECDREAEMYGLNSNREYVASECATRIRLLAKR